MNSWLKTGKGMMSQLIDVVAPQPMPIAKRRKKKKNEENENRLVLFTSLNEDCSYVCCGTYNGFKIFRCKPFEQIFESTNIIPLKLRMHFDKSLIAILTSTKHRKEIKNEELKQQNEYKLQLYNIKTCEFIWSISPSIDRSFENIKFALNRERLIITLDNNNTLSIFDITNKMKQLYPSIMTYDNNGIFDLCQDCDNCLLAYCDQSGKGRIGIIDAFNLQKKSIIDAHDSSLQIIKFNYNGNYIASASNKGTLIRIFSTLTQKNIATFRRGTFNSKINCLSFNPSSTKLCCSSINSDTIHIFDLNQAIKIQQQQSLKKQTNQQFKPTLNVVTDYLPISVKNTIEHPRSCVDIQIIDNSKNDNYYNENDDDDQHSSLMECGFINDNSMVIVTQNGYFYRYLIKENEKENMNRYKLLSEHSLKRNNDHLFHQQTKIFPLPGDDDNNNHDHNDENHDHNDVQEQHIKQENENINTMENEINPNLCQNEKQQEDDDDNMPYIQYTQFEPGQQHNHQYYGNEDDDDDNDNNDDIDEPQQEHQDLQQERKENNGYYGYNENEEIMPSPPESPASQSPEIFHTDYQNTINENDNFKLDLQSNYT